MSAPRKYDQEFPRAGVRISGAVGRARGAAAEGEPQYGDLEARLFERPVITVPTITIGSDFDGAAADGRAYAEKFSGAYSHRVLEGIAHNVPQEAPGAFTDAILEIGGGLP
jgi:pimeloyl-ACP methyl ester carboxylesterase